MYNKVLVVDDSHLDQMIIEKIIRINKFANHVVSFDNVVDALEYLHQFKGQLADFPEVIFVDIQMPGLDGFDFLERYIEFSEDIKSQSSIVMLSSSIAEQDRLRAASYPIVRKFFNKPLNNELLTELEPVPVERVRG
ncbi:MAG: response regulator [Flavipsychrobacter sp.]|nr:response regulator [Flavipsychrobacter sp.]